MEQSERPPGERVDRRFESQDDRGFGAQLEERPEKRADKRFEGSSVVHLG